MRNTWKEYERSPRYHISLSNKRDSLACQMSCHPEQLHEASPHAGKSLLLLLLSQLGTDSMSPGLCNSSVNTRLRDQATAGSWLLSPPPTQSRVSLADGSVNTNGYQDTAAFSATPFPVCLATETLWCFLTPPCLPLPNHHLLLSSCLSWYLTSMYLIHYKSLQPCHAFDDYSQGELIALTFWQTSSI